jgi:hypothetical protein
MATEDVKPKSEQDALFTQLAEPFDPSEIKWRVTHTNRDGNRGAVIAYADPRAYTDRLNQLFTPTCWSRTYEVSTVSAVTRMKRDKLIQTGKVLVTCTLTITGLGCHAGSGEEWADEENALTAAEAQAFKRSCVCFGLGRYLYNFAEMWVPLNEYRQPVEFPKLPNWALPKGSIPQRAILHPAHVPRRRNEGRSIRRQRRGLKDFGASLEIQSMGRSSGASRMHAEQTPFRMHSCKPMLPRRWSEPPAESARRNLSPTKLVRHPSLRSSTDCESSP